MVIKKLVVGFCSLWLASCRVEPTLIQAKAENNFKVFLNHRNAKLTYREQLKVIGCSGIIQEGAKYTFCTAQDYKGREFTYLCPFGLLPFAEFKCKFSPDNGMFNTAQN